MGAYMAPMDDYSSALIIFTWVWEWLAITILFGDFCYYLAKEWTEFGGNVATDLDIAVKALRTKDIPPVGPMPVPASSMTITEIAAATSISVANSPQSVL